MIENFVWEGSLQIDCANENSLYVVLLDELRVARGFDWRKE